MIKAEIKDSELKEYLDKLPKDEMLVFTMSKGRVRGAVFGGTSFVNTMRAQHGTGILETYILGQASLCGALMIPAKMKGMEHINIHYDVASAPAKGFNVEADSRGWVRGYLLTDHIPIEKPLENWDMTPFLGGEGVMTVQTVHPDDKFPATSSVETTGNIAEDLSYFFDKSEQVKTAINTSILFDRQGRVVGAGGLFIQVLPETGGSFEGKQNLGSQINTSADQDADEKLIGELEETLSSSPSLGTWFSQGKTGEQLIEELFGKYEPVVAVRREIKWDCPCTKDFYLNYIRTLDSNDVKAMKEKGEVLEVRCTNCGSVYSIDPSEI